ncbi:MAG: hypothetical protein F4063_01890, partial [Chloroflexi bacterium]|nr:hypothetical protein [Chloroflexota bacterium]
MTDPTVDASKTIIFHAEEPPQPPPRAEVGILGWLRQNLFGSPSDTIVSVLVALLIVALTVSFLGWTVRS